MSHRLPTHEYSTTELMFPYVLCKADQAVDS